MTKVDNGHDREGRRDRPVLWGLVSYEHSYNMAVVAPRTSTTLWKFYIYDIVRPAPKLRQCLGIIYATGLSFPFTTRYVGSTSGRELTTDSVDSYQDAVSCGHSPGCRMIKTSSTERPAGLES